MCSVAPTLLITSIRWPIRPPPARDALPLGVEEDELVFHDGEVVEGVAGITKPDQRHAVFVRLAVDVELGHVEVVRPRRVRRYGGAAEIDGGISLLGRAGAGDEDEGESGGEFEGGGRHGEVSQKV